MHTHALTHTYIHTHNSAPATAGAVSEEEKEETAGLEGHVVAHPQPAAVPGGLDSWGSEC